MKVIKNCDLIVSAGIRGKKKLPDKGIERYKKIMCTMWRWPGGKKKLPDKGIERINYINILRTVSI